MKDRIEQVADVLMGAAYADDLLHGREKLIIRQLLEGLAKADAGLLKQLDLRIEAFSPQAFKLQDSATVFCNDSVEQKRMLLQLVAAVGDADEETDLREDEYLKNLAAAINLAPEHFSDLVLQIEEADVSDLEEDFDDVRFAE